MKKFLYLLALCAMTMVSCEEWFADDKPQKPEPTPIVPEQPEIEFQLTSEESVEISAKGGECVITYAITNPDETLAVNVTPNVKWIAESDAFDATPNQIRLVVEANQSVEPRSAEVVVTYGKFVANVLVNQAADEELLQYLSGIYHGNSNFCDYNYRIALSSAESAFDIVTGEECVVDGNQYLFLDLYSSESSAQYNVKFSVPEGVYSLDAENSGEAGSLGAEYSYLCNAANQKIYFKSGKVAVEKGLITAELVGADNKKYRFYTLKNSVDNKTLFKGNDISAELSTLTENLEIPSEAASLYAEPYGDYYVIGKDMWLLYIDYDTGHSLVMEILTPIGAMPVGEFPISSDLNKARMALPGFADGDEKNWWSWYYCYDGYDVVGQAPIVSGNLKIVDDGAGNHTASFTFKEAKGLTISGSCTAYFETYGEVSLLSAKRRVVRPSRK